MIPPISIGRGFTKPKKQSHTGVVEACIELLEAYGCKAWKHHNGTVQTNQGRWLTYGKVGCPDIVFLTKNGRFGGCEVKIADDDFNDDQVEFRHEILEKRGIYILARDNTDAVERAHAEILSESW